MKEEFNSQEKETYITPDMRILEIETEQNILQNGSETGTESQLDDMGDSNW